MIECANPNCSNKFEQVKHNQKYCTAECCKVVTNAELMRQYYAKKARLAGKKRMCIVCDEVQLSRYNSTECCSLCNAREKTAKRQDLIKSLGLNFA